MIHHNKTIESSDAASRFLAMQRNIVGSDLLKQLQLGNMGSEAVPSTMNSNNFGQANNFSSLGLAGLAAAAGLAGLPLSSSGISPMNNSVPTIAALLAASQEKIVADFKQNLNGIEKEHDVQHFPKAKEYFELNEESINRLNEIKDLKRSMSTYSSSNEKDCGNDEILSNTPKPVLETSPPSSRPLSSPQEHHSNAIFPSHPSRRKYSYLLIISGGNL